MAGADEASIEIRVRLFGALREDLDKEALSSLLEQLLEEFHLTAVLHSRGLSLSGGERRRLEIARALVTEPRLILLDEPFAGVDPIATAGIRQMVRGLKDRGIAVLVTDHDVASTLRATDRTYIMDEGKVLFAGTPQEVLDDPLCRRVYIGEDFQLDLSRQSEEPQNAGNEVMP